MDPQCSIISKFKTNLKMMGCLPIKHEKPAAVKTMKAALLIQRWYRRYLARMEVRRRYTWTIFQSIEYAGEQDQVKLYNFFNALLTHIPDASGRTSDSQASSRASSTENLDSKYSDESDDYGDQKDCDSSEKTYRGPHLKFPLEKKDVHTLIDLFRKKKCNRLHAKYVAGILRDASNKLKRLPNLNPASTAISKQVTICGDLHGKLDDLLVVFHKNGLPSTENPYVFNGDFVDRGKKGLEVFLLLLSCFLVFPGGVFLNRGNHEDTVMNARYGFIKEVQQKYTHNSEKLLKLIEEVYRWLPLGTIVNNRVLIVHGGISDTTNLDLIKSLDRGKYVSILRPPISESGTGAGEGIDKVEWKQVFDIMWSDPQHLDGCEPNSLRGAGTYFGPDVTQTFLQKYKLSFLVRSHECKPDGHELTHAGKVITIFSASNYYAIGSNKGAYLKLNPQLDTHFVQYTSAASKTRKLTFRQRVGLIESSALQELGAKLLDKRHELEREFNKRDPKRTGKLSLSKWCEAMEEATRLGLPWRMLREKLAPSTVETNSSGQTTNVTEVYYRSTLELLDTDIIKTAQAGSTSVADSLYKNKSSLETIFRILDKDNSGYISLEEFGEACDLLEHHLPGTDTREQLLEMCKMMDINKDGSVDINEFLEAFRLCEQARRGEVPSSVNSPCEAKTISIADKNGRTAKDTQKASEDDDGDIDPYDHDSKMLVPKTKQNDALPKNRIRAE